MDSFFDKHVMHEDVWSNPDFALLLEYLQHFLSSYQRSPYDTSRTFFQLVVLGKFEPERVG
jgi:hypothetical protein